MADNQVKASGDDSAQKPNALAFMGTAGANLQYQDSSVTAQSNVLDQYASYTYNISWYIVKPQDIQRMMNSGTIGSLPANQLIVNTGGIAANNRNSNFDIDFFIERLTMQTSLSGSRDAGVAATTNTMQMTLVEPYGITFVQRLAKAVNELYGTSVGNAQGGSGAGNQSQTQLSPMAAFNLIVVRFYGYDDAGNLVRGGKNSSIVEKYFVTKIQKLTYKVSVKQMIEYSITMQVDYSAAQKSRASVTQPIELGGSTVQDVLAGPSSAKPTSDGRQSGSKPGTQATTTAPPKAGAATNQNSSVRSSLAKLLNEEQQTQVKNGIYTYPDEFVVEFSDQKIAAAKITVQDGTMKGTAPPANANAPQKVDKDKNSVARDVRIQSFNPGTPTVQVIDNIVRNSTYITSQSNSLISEKTGQITPNQNQSTAVNWFKINMQAVPLKWDPKRNDFAYRYRYVVSPYKVSDLLSPYFNNPQSPGVHKRYDYMYTGKNTQVLDWELKLNNQFMLFMTKPLNEANKTPTGSVGVSTAGMKMYAPTSGQSSQGAKGKTNEVAASAADYLYDQESMAKIELSIIGDPAWLLQGEQWQLDAAVSSPGQPFLPDGTINADTMQILFELVVNTPQDYDLSTGLMDPNTRPTLYKTAKTSPQGMSAQSYIVRATDLESDFSQGKFTQKISGLCVQYNPDQTVRSGAGRK